MDYTHRIQPMVGGTDPSKFFLILYGYCTYDLAVPADVALIDAGEYKPITWYTVEGIGSTPPAAAFALDSDSLPAMSAWELDWVTTYASDTNQYYDECCELVLDSSFTPVNMVKPLACAWLYPASTPNAFEDTVEYRNGSALIGRVMTYQGGPIQPNYKIRSGLLSAVSHAAATVTYKFELRVLRYSAFTMFGGSQIDIPSPFTVPPFVPGGGGAWAGSYLFSSAPATNYPHPQMHTGPRRFRSKMIVNVIETGVASVSAVVLGGPWRAKLQGENTLVGDMDLRCVELIHVLAPQAGYPIYQSTGSVFSVNIINPVDAFMLTIAEETAPGSVTYTISCDWE